MTTGKIHLSARWPRYQYCAPYPARARLLSRARCIAEKMSEWINHPDNASERASEKIQGGTSVSVKFTTNIFLPPPRKQGRIYVSRLRRCTRASQPQGERNAGARIYLCAAQRRVHNIERNNPPSPRPWSRFRFRILSIAAPREEIRQSLRSETPAVYSALNRRCNFVAV